LTPLDLAPDAVCGTRYSRSSTILTGTCSAPARLSPRSQSACLRRPSRAWTRGIETRGRACLLAYLPNPCRASSVSYPALATFLLAHGRRVIHIDQLNWMWQSDERLPENLSPTQADRLRGVSRDRVITDGGLTALKGHSSTGQGPSSGTGCNADRSTGRSGDGWAMASGADGWRADADWLVRALRTPRRSSLCR